MVFPRQPGGGGKRVDPRQMFADAHAAQQAGQLDKAEKLYRAFLKVQPHNPDACNNLALVHQSRGQLTEALKLVRRAIEITPRRVEYLATEGGVLLAMGQVDAAIRSYERAIEVAPRMALPRFGHAIALHRAGRLADAEATLREAIRSEPNSWRGWFDLGAVLREQGRFDDARACFERAVAIEPRFVAAWNELGNLARARNDGPAALAAYQRALAVVPNDFAAGVNLSNVYRELGRQADAVPLLRKVISATPDRPEPRILLALAEIKRQRDADVEWLAKLAAAPESLGRDAHVALFAYAKVLEDLGDHHRAFEVLIEANRRKRATLDYDVERDVARLAAIRETFSPQALARVADVGCPDPAPVFVLGLPRSCTSLVEQILASHPAIAGAGELDDLRQLVESNPRLSGGHPAAFANPDPAVLRAVGEEYVARLRRAAPGTATHVVDKAPSNALRIGAIRMCLPRAKIVRCVRDPRDVCLSIFRHDLVGDVPYAWDLAELGRYAVAHEQLMAHWRRVIGPEFLYELDYQVLLDDFEAEVRRLCAFLGVPFDARCLEFHRTERIVRTASMQQVRQPLFRSSAGAWRRHEAALAPLLRALESGGRGAA